MTKFRSEEIVSFFDIINESKINYILLRNIQNELPHNLSKKKDIDILVKSEDKENLRKALLEKKWKIIPHPSSEVPFLYSMNSFDFYDLNGLHIDVAYELACRSIITRQWIPLDQKIQNYLWENKKESSDQPWKYMLPTEIELIHLLTRCIFDKSIFNDGYVSRINKIYTYCNKDILLKHLELVFFSFSKQLINMIENREFNLIINKYLTFTEY